MKVWKRVCMIATAVTLILAGFSSTATIYRINPILAAEEEEDSTTETESAVWDGSTDTSWYDSEETVFHISTAEELAGLAALVNNGKSMQGQTIFLDADIILNDISNYENWSSEAPANKWTSIAENSSYAFQGTLDGQEHSIKGLYQSDRFRTNYTGLFGYTDKNSSVKNLTLLFGYIKANYYYNYNTHNSYIGGFIGFNRGNIYNCNNKIVIDSNFTYCYDYVDWNSYYDDLGGDNNYIGGICGYNDNGKIFNCINQADVFVKSNFIESTYANYSYHCHCYSGGISGKNNSGEVSHCMNNAIISTDSFQSSHSGGIVGYSTNANISNCINESDIQANQYSGGIIGYSDGTDVVNCANKAAITADTYSGGIVGYENSDYEIKNCYNWGEINSSNYSGGILGSADSAATGTISNVYSTGMIATGEYVGGIAGSISTSSSTMTSCYYSSDSAIKGIGSASTDPSGVISKNKKNMLKQSFIDSLGDAFTYQSGSYPLLKWEVGIPTVSLDKTNLIMREFGEQETLTASTTDFTGTPIWISDNVNVATVEDGVVTAVKNGTATIYVICGESRAVCRVTVGYDYYLDQTGIILDVNKTAQLTLYSSATMNPAEDLTVEWSSSDDSIVKVDETGLVTAVSSGTAMITAKAASLELTCKVVVNTVEPPPVVEDPEELRPTTATIYVGETTALQVLNYSGEVNWLSENDRIATISEEGIVTGVQAGEVTVYALLANGKTFPCVVTINPAITTTATTTTTMSTTTTITTESNYTSIGDINEDNSFNLLDIVLLQKWLLAVPDTELKYWQNADFYEDGKLDVFDLCFMKRALLSQ